MRLFWTRVSVEDFTDLFQEYAPFNWEIVNVLTIAWIDSILALNIADSEKVKRIRSLMQASKNLEIDFLQIEV
ncbi:hypothetical protein J6TS7_32390 [Paenibacillus dendritiformis]|uniref:hypothetical protein n=1 Tax=Paenibacillus TaxID=44249 RepID=UPI001B1A3FD2|nr:hypothetical protein [Paenibacillus dendritiformis]GIO79629.1 hypothetical protein J6TS7_32390 [Paenibacillus dendritiformis]